MAAVYLEGYQKKIRNLFIALKRRSVKVIYFLFRNSLKYNEDNVRTIVKIITTLVQYLMIVASCQERM